MNKSLIFLLIALCSLGVTAKTNRKFIAHRGVDLKHTIAGENSLEAISLAKRAGFDAIETDVRLTADDTLVVMHDATLNRTCLNADGTELTEPVEIKNLTWAQLQKNYKLKADDPARQSKIPTLRHYLQECKKIGIFPFIEPKLVDSTGNHYQDIMRIADAVQGRNNYIITSNNRANNIIRYVVKDKEVPLMGILYQTTYPAIYDLGNCIMAISATKFQPEEYAKLHLKAHADGLLSESHADKFQHFDMINGSPVNWVSTDMLVPDYHGQGKKVKTGAHSDFGGLYVTFDIIGEADVEMGTQKFTVTSPDKIKHVQHQVALYNESPKVKVTPKTKNTKIKNLKIRQVEF